jgi:tetratricopeptide (TPR) repeat protein
MTQKILSIVLLIVLSFTANHTLAGDITNTHEMENSAGAKRMKKIAQMKFDLSQLSKDAEANRSNKVKFDELMARGQKLLKEIEVEGFTAIQELSSTPKDFLEKGNYLNEVRNLALACMAKESAPCEPTLTKASTTIDGYWGKDKDMFVAQSQASIGDYYASKKDYKKALGRYRSAYDAYATIPCGTSHVWNMTESLNFLHYLKDEAGKKTYLAIVSWCDSNNKFEVKGTKVTFNPTKAKYEIVTPKSEPKPQPAQPAIAQAPQEKEVKAKSMIDFISEAKKLSQGILGGDEALMKQVDAEMRKGGDPKVIKQLDAAKLRRAENDKKAQEEFAQLKARDPLVRKQQLDNLTGISIGTSKKTVIDILGPPEHFNNVDRSAVYMLYTGSKVLWISGTGMTAPKTPIVLNFNEKELLTQVSTGSLTTHLVFK